LKSNNIDNSEEGMLRGISEEERKERLNTPTIGEIEMPIDKLRNNRSAGPDNKQTKVIEFGKPILFNTLQQAIHEVWTTEKIQEEWEQGMICIFEQYIPVVFINNHKYNCMRGYKVLTQLVVVSQMVFITL
jgi:hypothetical protein